MTVPAHPGSAIADLLAVHRLVPTVGLTARDEAAHVADALVRGGLPVIEVTLRNSEALDRLAEIAPREDILVGAGTVRTPAQLRAAIDLGARFVVSPCLTPALAEAAAGISVPYLPGVATPSELQLAVDAGYRVVKFFPAEANGGVRALRALSEVFPEMRFVPTGGITGTIAPDYFALDAVVAVGGSWMIPRDRRAAGDWESVRFAIRAAIHEVRPAA